MNGQELRSCRCRVPHHRRQVVGGGVPGAQVRRVRAEEAPRDRLEDRGVVEVQVARRWGGRDGSASCPNTVPGAHPGRDDERRDPHAVGVDRQVGRDPGRRRRRHVVVEPAVLVVDDDAAASCPRPGCATTASTTCWTKAWPSLTSAGAPSALAPGGSSMKCGSMNDTLGSVPAFAWAKKPRSGSSSVDDVLVVEGVALEEPQEAVAVLEVGPGDRLPGRRVGGDRTGSRRSSW